MSTLHVTVSVTVDDEPLLAERTDVVIPPDYNSADLAALMVRVVEDTAFRLVQENFGRQPTKRALLAATARLIAIREILDGPDGVVPREVRIRAVLDATNDEAIAQWGEGDVE